MLSEDEIAEQVLTAQAAGWLLGTTSNRADQIAAAQFICTLNSAACVPILEDPGTWRRLVVSTHEAFDVWHSRPSETHQEIAEVFGSALCHVLLQFSKDTVKMRFLTDLPLYQSQDFGGTFLRAFEFASSKYSCHKPEDEEMIFHIAFLSAIISIDQIILEYQWPRLARVCLTGRRGHLADVLLSLWAILFSNIDPRRSRQPYVAGGIVDQGDDETLILQRLSNAVICGARVLPSVQGSLKSDLLAVRGFTACLQRVAELSPQIPRDQRIEMIDAVVGLMLSYVDPLTSSSPGESGLELVGFSNETVLALHSLMDKNLHPLETSTSRDAKAEQFRNAHLINAAVRIISDDFESLSNSNLLPRSQTRALARAGDWTLTLARKGVREESRDGVRARVRDGLRRVGRLKGAHLEALTLQLKEEAMTLTRAEALVREVKPALARVVSAALTPELAWGMPPELAQELASKLEPELAREMTFQLVWRLICELVWGLDPQLDEELDRALNRALARALGAELDVLAQNLVRRLKVESSIIRVLLWAWKWTSSTQLDPDRRDVTISSCQLWAPLETIVDLIVNGVEWGAKGKGLTLEHDRNRGKLLSPEDLNGIVEFVEDLQKDAGKFVFIVRKADVEINRLCAHFNRRVDWDYDLYDFREQPAYCPRSAGKGLEMMW
ncbi:hypothetical protein FS837_008921 [Tulasnella sp. UAMH 9824]|nr:hypothetical protein FS837_008921 [Tulasnella sp. UAMH 9824]